MCRLLVRSIPEFSFVNDFLRPLELDGERRAQRDGAPLLISFFVFSRTPILLLYRNAGEP